MPLCKKARFHLTDTGTNKRQLKLTICSISVDGYIAGVRGQLSFSQFNIDKILTHGASLLGSEGVEYDAQELGESSAFIACRM